MGPVNDSGIKNFFKNFWQPWQAPKGERTAPVIGFIAATVLFLPLFLPAVGIAALTKWAVKHVKDSSREVRRTASKVEAVISQDDTPELPEVTTREQRESYLDSVRAKKEGFQAFLDRLDVSKECDSQTLRVIEYVPEKIKGLGEILSDLESHIGDSKRFNSFMMQAEDQIGWLQRDKEKIELDLNDPKYKGQISLKPLSS